MSKTGQILKQAARRPVFSTAAGRNINKLFDSMENVTIDGEAVTKTLESGDLQVTVPVRIGASFKGRLTGNNETGQLLAAAKKGDVVEFALGEALGFNGFMVTDQRAQDPASWDAIKFAPKAEEKPAEKSAEQPAA